ncbi:unnamed protein product [Trichogramma brassicae]|uniref:Uncharacterized protein n=1 Tax=Trichogramma brassicae TaxID=86971 RepID=A0A6H5I5N8_9HYME|nr:unnamed protein product [Trichogramma brassicae]
MLDVRVVSLRQRRRREKRGSLHTQIPVLHAAAAAAAATATAVHASIMNNAGARAPLRIYNTRRADSGDFHRAQPVECGARQPAREIARDAPIPCARFYYPMLKYLPRLARLLCSKQLYIKRRFLAFLF